MQNLNESTRAVNNQSFNSGKARRDLLRSLTQAQSGNPEPKRNREREISNVVDAINHILSRLKCPTEFRAYIDAVIGAADGRVDWFESSDLEIGKRMLGGGADGKSVGAIKKRVQRDRKTFNDWQHRENYTLIETDTGGKKDGAYFKTRYRIPLLTAAAAVLETASESAFWESDQSKAIRDASKIALFRLDGNITKRDRFKRPRQDDESQLNRNRKTILTLLGKSLAIIERNGGDPVDYVQELLRAAALLSTPEPHNAEAQSVHIGTKEPCGQTEGAWAAAAACHMDKSVPPISQVVENSTGYDSDNPEARQTPLRAEPEPIAEALAMVEAFESVGADRFDVTITDEAGEKVDYSPGVTAPALKQIMDDLIPGCEQARLNIIIRPPRGADRRPVQLDDLDQAAVDRVADFAFLTFQTSPGNYQAWVAIEGGDDSIARRLKIGCGADRTASEATRVAGSLNFKPKHAPQYPRVKITRINGNRTVKVEELERAGLIAQEPEPMPPPHAPTLPVRNHSGSPRRFPSYELSLASAPRAHNHDGHDRSKADFNFCLIALSWGWSVEETAEHLVSVSAKAQAEGVRYARHTAERAASLAQSRKGMMTA